MSTSIRYEWSTGSSDHTRWRSSVGPEVVGGWFCPPSSEEYNLFSFLATAQKLDIDMLPIEWESSIVGLGGTARIHEKFSNSITSLAFKRIHPDDIRSKPQEHIFRMLITEIMVLKHPVLSMHANVVSLEGICWDISTHDHRPWPVLVFEKTEFGDLTRFSRLPLGREMGIEQRLRLCLDIAKAIKDMHSHGITARRPRLSP